MTETAIVEPSFALAFLAGLASFLSPCIFPLVPGYLSAISVRDGKTGIPEGHFSLLVPTALFVLGFSFVFSLMGTSASFLGSFLTGNKDILAAASGALIMVFGVFTMELVNIPALQRERTLRLSGGGGFAYVFLIGCAFAIGWTPCIGPMLASILSYAALSQEPSEGVALLLVYSAGLGMPFIAAGLFLSQWRRAAVSVRKYYGAYKYVVGGMMVVAGFLIAADLLFYVNVYGQKIFQFLGIDFWMRI